MLLAVSLLLGAAVVLLNPQATLEAAAQTTFGTTVCGATATIKFAQSAVINGSAQQLGKSTRAGFAAAFHEANVNNELEGLHLELETYNDQYDPSKSVAYARELTNRTNEIFAMVGWVGTATVEAAMPIVLAAGYPLIGTFTGAPFLRSPFNKQIVNFRPSYMDEAAAMVEYLINVRKFSRIAIFLQNDSFGEVCLQGVVLALDSNNLRLHSEGRYARGSENITAALAAISGGETKPQAVILAGLSNPSALFILEAMKILPEGTMYLAISAVTDSFRDLILSRTEPPHAIVKNIVITQIVPLPSNASLPIVARYQAAINASSPGQPYDFLSFEAYLNGRLIVQAIRRIGSRSFTREMLLDAIYESGNFNFNGLRCGPYLPRDVNGGCNICMRRITFTTINPDGSYGLMKDQESLEFDSCGYRAKVWQFIKFGQSLPKQPADDSSAIGLSFNAGIRAAFQEVNDKGGLLGIKLALVSRDDQNNPELARSNIQALASDPEILAIIGSSVGIASTQAAFEAALAADLPFIGSPSGAMSLRQPFQRHAISFRASQFDELAGLINYLYLDYQVTKVSIIYSDDTAGREARTLLGSALSSRRLEIFSESTMDIAQGDIAGESLLAALRSDRDGAPEAVLLVGPPEVVAGLVLEGKKRSDGMWYLTLSSVGVEEMQSHLFRLATAAGISLQLAAERVIVPRVVPLPNDAAGLKAVKDFRSAMDSLDKTLPKSAAALEGYLTARMLISGLQRLAGAFDSREKLIDAFYDSGTFSFGGLQCGPFDNADDATASLPRPGCGQCMKRVWLTGIAGNGSLYDLPALDERLSFGLCGATVLHNVDFQLNGARLAIVILAGIHILMAVILMAVLTYHREYILLRGGFRFSMVTCFGAILCFATVFTLYPIPTHTVCMAQPWIGHLSFCFIFGPLFAKTRRVAMIFNNKKLVKLLITDAEVMAFFAGILVFFLTYLAVWTGVDGPRMREYFTNDRDPSRYEGCSSTYSWGPWGIVVLEGLMLLWGSLLCFRVKDVGGRFQRFNESRQIGFAIYNTSFLGALLIFLTFMNFHPNEQFILMSIFIMLNTSVVLGVLFGKPVYLAITGVVITESQLAGGGGSSAAAGGQGESKLVSHKDGPDTGGGVVGTTWARHSNKKSSTGGAAATIHPDVMQTKITE